MWSEGNDGTLGNNILVERRKWSGGGREWSEYHKLPEIAQNSVSLGVCMCDLPSSILSRTWMMSPSSKLTCPSP